MKINFHIYAGLANNKSFEVKAKFWGILEPFDKVLHEVLL